MEPGKSRETAQGKDDRPVILLLENDENDVFQFRRALSKLDWNGNLRVVGSVSEARGYIENSFPFTDRSYYRCPSLIVSDYRLNNHTAEDFIVWLRENPACSEVPVVVMTGMRSGIPPERLARMAPTGFIVKTPDVMAMAEVLKQYLP